MNTSYIDFYVLYMSLNNKKKFMNEFKEFENKFLNIF